MGGLDPKRYISTPLPPDWGYAFEKVYNTSGFIHFKLDPDSMCGWIGSKEGDFFAWYGFIYGFNHGFIHFQTGSRLESDWVGGLDPERDISTLLPPDWGCAFEKFLLLCLPGLVLVGLWLESYIFWIHSFLDWIQTCFWLDWLCGWIGSRERDFFSSGSQVWLSAQPRD